MNFGFLIRGDKLEVVDAPSILMPVTEFLPETPGFRLVSPEEILRRASGFRISS